MTPTRALARRVTRPLCVGLALLLVTATGLLAQDAGMVRGTTVRFTTMRNSTTMTADVGGAQVADGSYSMSVSLRSAATSAITDSATASALTKNVPVRVQAGLSKRLADTRTRLEKVTAKLRARAGNDGFLATLPT